MAQSKTVRIIPNLWRALTQQIMESLPVLRYCEVNGAQQGSSKFQLLFLLGCLCKCLMNEYEFH